MDALTVPVLRIALDALHNMTNGAGATSQENPLVQPLTPSSSALDAEAEDFLKRLLACCKENAESFVNVNRIIQVGFRDAAPVLTKISSGGIQQIASALPESASGGYGVPSHAPFLEGFPERAMLGEAALQALMKVPKHELEESAFDIMAKSIAKIGGVVLGSAHGTIEETGFAVKAILTASAIGTASINETTAIEGTMASDAKATADEAVVDNNGSANLKHRRDKGFSIMDLEIEVLDYYRGLA